MISTATQNGSRVEVYDERGALMFTKGGTLVGYTSTTVSIQNAGRVEVYDERGNLKFTR